MSASLQKLIKQYLQYFYWFLEDELNADELDYMLYLRDRIHESGGELGDLDFVWRANAKKMLKQKSVLQSPMSKEWWWKEDVWRRFASTHNSRRTQSRRRISSLST